MSDFDTLHGPWEGDWGGFDTKSLQEFVDSGASFVQSGYSDLDYTKQYILRWSDWQTTDNGFGGIRLNFYDASYTQITGTPYVDIYFQQTKTDGWRKNIVNLKPYKDEVGPYDIMIPSGTYYSKIKILMPEVSGIPSERYIQELDLVQGNNYIGYTTFSGDSTFVTYKGLANGYYSSNPLLRETYEFIGQRLWKSEDASTQSNEFITYTDNGAANNTEYTYVIDAFDLNGNKSPLSETKTIMAGDVYAPAQVSGLVSVSGPESIILIWNAPADPDYSHVNIYSDVGLTVLVKPEFGNPGAKDTTVIGGLLAGTSYTFYLCSVDAYGNENRISPPSATGVPTSFSATEDLLVTLDGDDYLRQETETFKVFSRVQLTTVPTVNGWDSSNNALTIGTVSLVSAGIVTLYSGSFSVGAGNVDGQGRLLATGTTVSGSNALSPFKLFTIDKTAPTISINPVEYNYDSGTKKFYNKNSMGKFTVSITDAGEARSFLYRLNSSSNSEWLPYLSGVNNGATVLLPQEGLNTIYVKARDMAGNESSESSMAVYRDSEAPIVSISGVGSSSQNGLWTNSTTNLSVKFLAKDNEAAGPTNVAGISGVLWRYAYNRAPDTGDSWNTINGANPTITVPPTGSIPAGTASIQLEYYGMDNAGNTSEHVVETLNIDNVAPTFTAGLWGNCQPVPGGFSLVWDPTKITDAAPSSGLKEITIYRDTSSAMTTKTGVTTISFNVSGTRSYVDSSSALENYKWYWWAMDAVDNAGNRSTLSTTVSGQIGHNITGIFRNLISNGSFERTENYDVNLPQDWWKVGSPTIDKSSSPYHGSNYAIVDNANYYYIYHYNLINAKTTKRMVFSCQAKKTSASATLSGCVTFKFYDANKTLIQTNTKNYALLNGTWSGINIPIGNSAPAAGFDLPSAAGVVTALSCDIIISGNQNPGSSVCFDAVQLEEPVLNTTTTGTAYVDSYNITADILQGQRIIGDLIEAKTVNLEHLTVSVHGGNCLPNSSFEMLKYDNSAPAGWNLATNCFPSSESSFDGTKSLCFSGTGLTAASCNDFIKFNTNKDYCISYKYRTKTASTANMAIILYQYDANKNILLNGSTPYTMSGALNVNSTEWATMAIPFGPNSTLSPQPTCAYVIVTIQKNAGEIIFVDAVQMEEGLSPTFYAPGGLTQIDGGTIKSGRIQDAVDGYTYFDLNNAEIRTSLFNDPANQYTQINAGRVYTRNTTGDYTDLGAGRLRAFDSVANKFTLIQSGELTNYNQSTGDYSRLTDGLLEFYNASAGLLTNYGNQITYIEPWELNCGTQYNFLHPYTSQPPIVVMIPNMFKCYASANSASDQYIGFDTQPVTKTGFLPKAFLYAGAPSNTIIPRATISDPTMTVAADSPNSYIAANARDIGHGGSVNSVYVTLRTSNTNGTHKIVTNTMTIRVASGISSPYTWDSSKIERTQIVALNTFKGDSSWNYTTVQFNGLGTNTKIVKVDWTAQSAPDTCQCELYQVQYINTPTQSGLTGTNIAGALVIGRTI